MFSKWIQTILVIISILFTAASTVNTPLINSKKVSFIFIRNQLDTGLVLKIPDLKELTFSKIFEVFRKHMHDPLNFRVEVI